MMSKKNKMIMLNNGKKLMILEECEYNNENYYFACEVNDDIPTDKFRVFKIELNENGKQTIKAVENNEVMQKVVQLINSKVN